VVEPPSGLVQHRPARAVQWRQRPGAPLIPLAMRAATCGEGDGGDEGAVGSGNVRRQVCEAKCEREEEKQVWAVF
jgi:hypothetical protein